MKLLSTLLVLGTAFIASSNCDKIPVFLWGTKTTIHTPALKTHDSENFDNFLRKQQTDDAVTVVFYENNLSTQDLTQCKKDEGTTCFEYLNSIQPSSYLPSVENPIDTLERYHEGNQLSTHLNTDGTFNLNFNDIEKGDIVFVSLADSRENEESAELFSRHDGVIRKFVEQLASKFEIIGIYTGNHAPVVHSLTKREVNQTETGKNVGAKQETTDPNPIVPNPQVLNSNHVLIYFTNMYYTTSDNSIKIMNNITLATTHNATHNYISVELTSGENDTFSFIINLIAGSYNVEKVIFNNVPMRFEEIHVNLPFSYHCGPGVTFRSKVSNVRLVWAGLQFEPQFNRTKFNGTYFSESWDCVGFTSGGVWMGLVIMFLLIGILSCGFSWMFDIKTMDRFDDPKGKTITITEME